VVAGRTIAFAGVYGALRAIFTVPASGGAVTAITDGAHGATYPAWRRDGAIAFQCECGYGMQIMLFEPGRGLRPLTRTLQLNRFPVFSPDGSRLVFTSDRDGHSALYQIFN
jgi:Tol biopolymer transport system component